MKSTGKCLLCKKVLNEKAMLEHMRECVETHAESKAGAKEVAMFHLVVRGRYLPIYWLHLEVPETTTLKRLDSFLRDTWLECCGHLSCFTIGGQRYASYPSEDDWQDEPEKSMGAKLASLLSKGMSFTHEYDYGSTTELAVHVVDRWIRAGGKAGVKILARNQPPPWKCTVCGKPASLVDATGFGVAPDMVYCEACAGEAEDPDCLSPLVNSPRTGVCGYDG